jgi:UbiD family decarboxylase
MMRAKGRGEGKVRAALCVGIDPISWILSASRLAGLGQDEFAIAGGLRGRPVELVRCESNDLWVPASSEIVLEGDIVNDTEPEGPYGELHGYMGKETETFTMDVHVITHREDPWIWNFWPGIEHSYMNIPWNALHYKRLKNVLPNLVKLYTPPEAPTVVIASIDKGFPGQGTEAGLLLMGYRPVGFTKKIVIIVDSDVEPTNLSNVVHAMGTNWQPAAASLPITNTYHTPVDPSTREPFMSSKMVIDATRQLPGEGGPEVYPETNRGILEREAPESFQRIREKWDSLIKNMPISQYI